MYPWPDNIISINYKRSAGHIFIMLKKKLSIDCFFLEKLSIDK